MEEKKRRCSRRALHFRTKPSEIFIFRYGTAFPTKKTYLCSLKKSNRNMSNDVRMGGFNILPPIVKNLLIINALFFLAKIVGAKFGIDLDKWLGLHFVTASDFYPWQIITYMFMHGDFGHLFFNMFALWMFGAAIENYWGAKRFLVYYLITGIGAAIVHFGIQGFMVMPELAVINNYLDAPSVDNLIEIAKHHQFQINPDSGEIASAFAVFNETFRQIQIDPTNTDLLNQCTEFLVSYKEYFLNQHVIIGASGAVFGLLLAFGMLFPNSQIYLYFLIPMKAKWFVILYGALELFYGVTGTQDGVAHFAHLGGMLFGIILILLWRKQERNRNIEW